MIVLRSLLAGALRDYWRVWPQLLLTDLLARALALAVLTPLVGLLLKLFLATTATGVVADQAIVAFLLHPIGVLTLVVVAAVTMSILFFESGQLMVIAFGAFEDRRVTWLDALGYSLRHLVGLLQLAGWAVVRLLLMTTPFLAGIAGVYWLLLTTYDINYYLSTRPPQFMAAAVISGFLAAVVLVLVVWRMAGWLLSVPMVLFENCHGKSALRASENATSARRTRLAVWIVGWFGVSALISVAVTSLVGSCTRAAIPLVREDLSLLLLTLSGFLVISSLANMAMSFFATTFFPFFNVHIYRKLAGPGEQRPVIAARGTLGVTPSWWILGLGVLAVSAIVPLAVYFASSFTFGDRRFEDTAQIIAHRGGAAVAPENTMAAFQRGIEDGADWLELDVQEDADGAVVVVHDSDYMRIAGHNLKVWRATKEDLADLDVGSFFAEEFADQRVPTLREVLELANGKAGLFIELKYYGHDVSLEQKVVDLVEETGMTAKIVIMSLEYDGVRKTAALRPDWTYGLLNSVAIGNLTRLDVDFLALTAHAASTSMIRRAHKRGMKIYPWTIDDPVQMWVMMSRGVDGIITDRVSTANQVMELRSQVTPVGRFIIWMAGESGLLSGMEHTSERHDA